MGPSDGFGLQFPCFVDVFAKSRDGRAFVNGDQVRAARVGDEEQNGVRADVDRRYAHFVLPQKETGPTLSDQPRIHH